MWWTADCDTATTSSFYTPHGLLENPLHINEMSLPSHTSHPVTDRVVFYPCNIQCIPSTTLIHPTLEYWRDTLHPSLAVSLETSTYYCMATTTMVLGSQCQTWHQPLLLPSYQVGQHTPSISQSSLIFSPTILQEHWLIPMNPSTHITHLSALHHGMLTYHQLLCPPLQHDHSPPISPPSFTACSSLISTLTPFVLTFLSLTHLDLSATCVTPELLYASQFDKLGSSSMHNAYGKEHLWLLHRSPHSRKYPWAHSLW